MNVICTPYPSYDGKNDGCELFIYINCASTSYRIYSIDVHCTCVYIHVEKIVSLLRLFKNNAEF